MYVYNAYIYNKEQINESREHREKSNDQKRESRYQRSDTNDQIPERREQKPETLYRSSETT